MMNTSPIGGDRSPFYECSIGGSITPTVVSNFNLPNSNLNKNGPYLQIVEQPQTKFRFRYKSEMVGTHGQLKAESSDKNRTVYPTVKLCNWNGGPALVRLLLYSAEDNANGRKKHVHELNGKNCNKEGFTGGCEVIVEEKNNYTAQFPNLGIIHIAKRDVQNIIYQRKKDELINLARMNNPGLRNESIQHNVSPTELQQLKEAAQEEAKAMDLNKVVLRFQAYFFDSKEQGYRPVTEYIDSEVIFNLKNASTGELKIVRISSACAPCTGGTEVWMLVEKVKKSNVRIKFYELDQDNVEVWKGYGEFKESDVHHQYAIVFRTPPYRYTNLREPVHIKVILERTTDHDTSEPLDFTYTPENLKRSNAFLESHNTDSEVYPQKRIRPNPMEPMDLKTNHDLFHGPRKLKQPYSPETPYKSPTHMVPSPITPADSPLSQGFYSPQHHGSVNHQGNSMPHIEDEASLYLSSEEKLRVILDDSFQDQPQAGNSEYSCSPRYYYENEGAPNNDYIPNMEGGNVAVNFSNGNYLNVSNSPYHQVPSPSYNQLNSPYSNGTMPSPSNSVNTIFSDHNQVQEDAYLQIQQFDAFQKQVINSKATSPVSNQFDFSDLVNSPNDVVINEDMPDFLDIISNGKFFTAPKDFGDIQADCARPKGKDQKESKSSIDNSSTDVDSLTEKMSSVSVKDANKVQQSKQTQSAAVIRDGRDMTMPIAMKAANCLQSYAATGDVNALFAAHKYLITVQNNNGANSLCSAILKRDTEAFKKITRMSLELKCQDIFASQNFDGESPLHIAVRLNEVEMVKQLIAIPGTDLSLVDCDGNTALHVAASLPTSDCLSALLSLPTKDTSGTNNSGKDITNQYNYNGQTPLHISVSNGSFDNMKILLQSGSLVHLCEQKQGANPLHLAVMAGNHKMAKYIIGNTHVTVDAGLLNQNTALHIAALARDKEMCSLLMAAMANPQAKNCIRKLSKNEETECPDDESSGDESDSDDYYTPIDYAGDDQEILSILNGKQPELATISPGEPELK